MSYYVFTLCFFLFWVCFAIYSHNLIVEYWRSILNRSTEQMSTCQSWSHPHPNTTSGSFRWMPSDPDPKLKVGRLKKSLGSPLPAVSGGGSYPRGAGLLDGFGFGKRTLCLVRRRFGRIKSSDWLFFFGKSSRLSFLNCFELMFYDDEISLVNHHWKIFTGKILSYLLQASPKSGKTMIPV